MFYKKWTQKIEGCRVKVEKDRTVLDQKYFVADELAREKREENELLALEERRALISVHGSMAKKLE